LIHKDLVEMNSLMNDLISTFEGEDVSQ